jgi:hypothetical protein
VGGRREAERRIDKRNGKGKGEEEGTKREDLYITWMETWIICL